jgi:hypothetical protein
MNQICGQCAVKTQPTCDDGCQNESDNVNEVSRNMTPDAAKIVISTWWQIYRHGLLLAFAPLGLRHRVKTRL